MTTTATSTDDQQELLTWLDEREARYEVIDGVVLGPSCAVYYDREAPNSFVMPDVLVATREHVEADGVRVPPLLVIEVLSPSTRRRDWGEKREIYAALGVPQYWLVDPERHTATVLGLTGGGYEEVMTAVGEIVVTDPFPIRVLL